MTGFSGPIDARGIHQDVQMAMGLDNAVDRVRRPRRVGKVHLHLLELSTSLFNRHGRVCQTIGVQVAEGHLGALTGEAQCRGLPDARRRPSNGDDFTLKCHATLSSCPSNATTKTNP